MRMKKRITLLLAAAALLAALLAAGASLAYFTDRKTTENTFTVGSVRIALTEPAWAADSGNILPGVPVDKDPTVTNTGSTPCLVRVRVEWPSAFDLACRTGGVTGALGDGWVDGGDGYCYYLRQLEPGAAAPPVFEQVLLSPETDGRAATAKFDATVTAYAIQAQGADPAALAELQARFRDAFGA